MTDKELLKLAAKAAGIKYEDNFRKDSDGIFRLCEWNPLLDDGAALRLAVKLNMSMDLFDNEILVGYTPNCNDCDQVIEGIGIDPYAAARRAIVRAAAEMGKVITWKTLSIGDKEW